MLFACTIFSRYSVGGKLHYPIAYTIYIIRERFSLAYISILKALLLQ